MTIGSGILGGSILGGGMSMVPSPPVSLAHSLYDGYRLDLLDVDGDLLACLVGNYEPQLSETLNEPETLSFSVPVNAWYVDLLVPPNYVALYDRAGDLVQVFEIVEEGQDYGETRTKTIRCAGPAYLLNDDSINYQNYDGDAGAPDTVLDTITAILATQTNTRKVTLGGVESSLAVLAYRISIDWETPLAGLHKIRDVIGGFFWVDRELKLWWRQTYKTGEVRQLRWEKNLIAFQPTIDNDGVITHLRYYGRKIGTAQIALPTPGYLVSPYYTSGDRKRWHTETDQDIEFQDTLEEAAALFLSEHERPKMRATVRILDLSKSPKYDFDSWYAVALGERVSCYHPSMGETPVELTVVSRTVDLSQPMDVSLDLGSMAPDITRVIAQIRGNQRRRERDSGGGGDVAGFETDPGMFQSPGTADTPSVGTSDNTIRSDAVLPILPGAGYTPTAITPGTGAGGTGPYAAPQDHSHPLAIDDLEAAGVVTTDTIVDDLIGALTEPIDPDLNTAIEAQITDLASDDEPEPIVSQSPLPGDSDNYARANHRHLGQPLISVADYGDLPSSGHADGVIGYTNGEDNEASWMLIAGEWRQHTIYLGEVSTLPAIPTAYCAFVKFALQTWSAEPGDTIWTPIKRQTTYSGAPGTVYP